MKEKIIELINDYKKLHKTQKQLIDVFTLWKMEYSSTLFNGSNLTYAKVIRDLEKIIEESPKNLLEDLDKTEKQITQIADSLKKATRGLNQ